MTPITRLLIFVVSIINVNVAFGRLPPTPRGDLAVSCKSKDMWDVGYELSLYEDQGHFYLELMKAGWEGATIYRGPAFLQSFKVDRHSPCNIVIHGGGLLPYGMEPFRLTVTRDGPGRLHELHGARVPADVGSLECQTSERFVTNTKKICGD
jgi:hypothetical protein